MSSKEIARKMLLDPKGRASLEYQAALAAIETFWDSKKRKSDQEELLTELACVDDCLMEIRDDYQWDGYEDTVTDISNLARCVGVYWPSWRDLANIEPWEIVGPFADPIPPKPKTRIGKISKRKETKMSTKKEVERRYVRVYQPGVMIENTPLEIRVTEPRDEKKLLGRLYISKGGVTWCNRKQHFDNKIGWSWEKLAKMLSE